MDKRKYIGRGLQKVPGINLLEILFVDNILFIINPKVASSSVKFSILRSVLKKDCVALDELWSFVSYKSVNEVAELSKKAKYVFAITRDPFSRLYSCYRQKILLEDGPRVTKNYFFQYFPLIRRDCSFDEFIDAVCRIPDSLAEKHFMSQYRILDIEKRRISFDAIFKIDDLWPLEDELKRLLGSTFTLGVWNTTGGAGLNSVAAHYQPRTLELVSKRYHDDLNAFGYHEFYERLKRLVNAQ